MSPQPISSFAEKTCSSCRHSASKAGFFRKGKEWKTCNLCSIKGSYHRKTHSVFVYDSLGRLMKGLQIGQPMGQELAQRQLQQQLAEQFQFEQQQFEQQQIQSQWMTIEYLLNDLELQSVPPQLHEQQGRLMHQTQQLYKLESMQARTDQNLIRQNSEPELSAQSFPAFPMDSNMGMPPQHQSLHPNMHSNFENHGAEQVDYNFNDSLGPGDPEVDFEECLANALLADLQTMNDIEQSSDELGLDNGIGRVDSMSPTECDLKYQPPSYDFDAMIDSNMIHSNPAATQGNILQNTASEPKAQRQAATKRVHKPMAAPFSLNNFFADFDASQDILRQPAAPIRDLIGAALAANLISELGLAVRLSQLHRRWNNMKQHQFLKEAELLNEMENKGSITPWAPLSNVLFIYEMNQEEFLDRYGHIKDLDWKTKAKAKVDMKRLANSVKTDMSQKALEIISHNTEALCQLFMDGSDHPENKVKVELNRQLRSLKAAVVENCENTGVLRLKVGARGIYVQG